LHPRHFQKLGAEAIEYIFDRSHDGHASAN
jgi:hypothetical protein